MSTEIPEPKVSNSREYLNVTNELTPILDQITDLLNAESSLKKGINSDLLTDIGVVNTVLGGTLTNGSMDTMNQLYLLFSKVIFHQISRLTEKRGFSASVCSELDNIFQDIQALYPFAHRTTVQARLNDHTKENSDETLGKNFKNCIEELEKLKYKPENVVINQDPHFVDFKPGFKNGEVRQILIGGKTTLKTGYQLNLTNISPLGLYNAIDLSPKRQENAEDLGDLRYATVYAKAAERVYHQGMNVYSLQGDRGLNVTGLFAVSQKHAWPFSSEEMDVMVRFTENVFLFTPWSSTHQTKAELFEQADFAEIMFSTSYILQKQYLGNDPLVQKIMGESPKSKIPIETVLCVLWKPNERYSPFSPRKVQQELSILTQKIRISEEAIKKLKTDYFCILQSLNPDYTERGMLMKLNSKQSTQIAKETDIAWQIRKQYTRAKKTLTRLEQKRNAFLRQFQVFEIGVNEAVLKCLKGAVCKERTQWILFLKERCKGYKSRWCIESGFELIEYQFPLQFHGNSSDTHLRVYVLQAMLYNSYRVAQIKQIGSTKPSSWRPWDPRLKVRCRQLDASDQRVLSTKGYLLGLLTESLNSYFCRALS